MSLSTSERGRARPLGLIYVFSPGSVWHEVASSPSRTGLRTLVGRCSCRMRQLTLCDATRSVVMHLTAYAMLRIYGMNEWLYEWMCECVWNILGVRLALIWLALHEHKHQALYISFYIWNIWLKHMKHALLFHVFFVYVYDHEWIYVNGWC